MTSDPQGQLESFWEAVARMQAATGSTTTDLDLARALLRGPGSPLYRLLGDEPLTIAFQGAIETATALAQRPGQGLSPVARAVVQAMLEETEARDGKPRDEYLILGLLREGSEGVRAVFGSFGIDERRITQGLPDRRYPVSPADLAPAFRESGPSTLLHLIEAMGATATPLRVAAIVAQIPNSAVARIANSHGYTSDDIRRRFAGSAGALAPAPNRAPEITETALRLAGQADLHVDHFVLALLEVGGAGVLAAFESLGVTADEIRGEVQPPTN